MSSHRDVRFDQHMRSTAHARTEAPTVAGYEPALHLCRAAHLAMTPDHTVPDCGHHQFECTPWPKMAQKCHPAAHRQCGALKVSVETPCLSCAAYSVCIRSQAQSGGGRVPPCVWVPAEAPPRNSPCQRGVHVRVPRVGTRVRSPNRTTATRRRPSGAAPIASLFTTARPVQASHLQCTAVP